VDCIVYSLNKTKAEILFMYISAAKWVINKTMVNWLMLNSKDVNTGDHSLLNYYQDIPSIWFYDHGDDKLHEKLEGAISFS